MKSILQRYKSLRNKLNAEREYSQVLNETLSTSSMKRKMMKHQLYCEYKHAMPSTKVIDGLKILINKETEVIRNCTKQQYFVKGKIKEIKSKLSGLC